MLFWLQAGIQYLLFFFFQAEDGIRDIGVTGVQTCALPIWGRPPSNAQSCPVWRDALRIAGREFETFPHPSARWRAGAERRSEERRVGKECRSRWSADH